MTNTQANIGLRKTFYKTNIVDRNFEDSGTVQYKALQQNIDFLGTDYNTGDLLPFDGGGVYTPKAIATLRAYWEAEYIQPAV